MNFGQVMERRGGKTKKTRKKKKKKEKKRTKKWERKGAHDVDIEGRSAGSR